MRSRGRIYSLFKLQTADSTLAVLHNCILKQRLDERHPIPIPDIQPILYFAQLQVADWWPVRQTITKRRPAPRSTALYASRRSELHTHSSERQRPEPVIIQRVSQGLEAFSLAAYTLLKIVIYPETPANHKKITLHAFITELSHDHTTHPSSRSYATCLSMLLCSPSPFTFSRVALVPRSIIDGKRRYRRRRRGQRSMNWRRNSRDCTGIRRHFPQTHIGRRRS
jgi:hypothetical protein